MRRLEFLRGVLRAGLLFSSQPRMKSVTQDRYWPDRLGSRTGGSSATAPNGLEKNWVALSVWPMAISVCSVWPIPIFRSVRSGQYPYFDLFRLINTHFSVCSVWPIPLFWSVRSGQYSYFGLSGLANTLVLASAWAFLASFKTRAGALLFFIRSAPDLVAKDKNKDSK